MRCAVPLLALLTLTSCGLETLPPPGTGQDSGDSTDSAVFGQLVVSASALDFGTVTEGSSASRTLTLRNDGEAPVEFLNVQVLDSDAFEVTTTLLGDLESGEELVLELEFTPDGEGAFAGTLVIETNATGAELINIPLAGTGTPEGGGGDDDSGGGGGDDPWLSVSASTVAFGTVDIGTTGSENMTITNTGGGDVLVKAFTFSSAEFTWGKEFSVPYVLGAGATRAFTLQFTPTDETAKTGSVTITSDDPNAPALVISVSGQGYDRCSICSGDPWVDTGSAGYVDLGASFGSKLSASVQVWNYGDLDLTVSSIDVENGIDFLGVSPGEFAVSGFSGPKVVKPGANFSFTVTYSSNGSSVDSSADHKLHILSDSSLNPKYTVGLSASCLATKC